MALYKAVDNKPRADQALRTISTPRARTGMTRIASPLANVLNIQYDTIDMEHAVPENLRNPPG